MSVFLADLVQASWDWFSSGGVVMFPLVLLSLWLWTLIFIKIADLSALGRKLRTPGALKAGFGLATGGKRLVQGQTQASKKIVQAHKIFLTRRSSRGISTIAVLAAAAPLLGLLGTVTGMIATFDVIQAFGTSDAASLAAGISEALMTTQTALAVALPGMFAAAFLRRRFERLERRIAARLTRL